MAKEKFEKDTWLYGSTKERKAMEKVAKAAGKSEKPLEASSDQTFEFLNESPRERIQKSKIVNWGGTANDRVTVQKSKSRKPAGEDGENPNEPPPSRQLRDPFTAFYVQGIALEPPLPPERLLNLTEENSLHSACLMAKATDACGRGWSFEPKDGAKVAPMPKPGEPGAVDPNAQPEIGPDGKPVPKPGDAPKPGETPPKPGEQPAPAPGPVKPGEVPKPGGNEEPRPGQPPAPEPGAPAPAPKPKIGPDGKPVIGPDGKPVMEAPIPAAAPTPAPKPKIGPDGKPVMGPDGKPVMEEPIPVGGDPNKPAIGPDGKPLGPPNKTPGGADIIHSDLPEKLKQAMEDLTPDLTFTELLYQAAWEMDAIGWSAWEVVRENNDGTPGVHGKIAAIYPIPAHTLRASLDPRKWVQIRAGRVRYFKKFGAECTINNETGDILDWNKTPKSKEATANMGEDYIASELIVFKTYTPRSLWYGLPRWVSSIATIAELSAIREFNISWFASGGQVDYHLHFKADNIEEAKTMKDDVENQIREFAGRGHTNLFTAGGPDSDVTANKLGDLLREGHFRFRRTDLIKEVLIAHCVPPYRIGWAETGSLGGNAAPEMLAAYQAGAIKPIQMVIEDRLRVTLFDPEIGIKTDDFRFTLKPMDLENAEGELKLAEAGVKDAFMTPNQAREKVGLEPDTTKPELDEYYWNGTKLGATPPVPTMPNPDGSVGQFPGGGGDPNAPDGGGPPDQGQPGQGVPQGPPPPGGGGAPPFGKKSKIKTADIIARETMVEMFRDYEQKLKAALVDEDPIDSEQPPTKPPKRGRTIPDITSVGPSREDLPNV